MRIQTVTISLAELATAVHDFVKLRSGIGVQTVIVESHNSRIVIEYDNPNVSNKAMFQCDEFAHRTVI